MTEGGAGSAPPEKKGLNFPSWRQIGEFVRRLLGLESTVDSLTKQVNALQVEVQALQRRSDEQAGQLSILMRFVQGALDDRLDARIRRTLDERSRTDE